MASVYSIRQRITTKKSLENDFAFLNANQKTNDFFCIHKMNAFSHNKHNENLTIFLNIDFQLLFRNANRKSNAFLLIRIFIDSWITFQKNIKCKLEVHMNILFVSTYIVY